MVGKVSFRRAAVMSEDFVPPEPKLVFQTEERPDATNGAPGPITSNKKLRT